MILHLLWFRLGLLNAALCTVLVCLLLVFSSQAARSAQYSSVQSGLSAVLVILLTASLVDRSGSKEHIRIINRKYG